MRLATIFLMVFQAMVRLRFPMHTPKGVTTVLLTIQFFGAFNLFAAALIGEYIAKISGEVQRRLLFIRRSVIRDGDIRAAAASLRETEERISR
jgi:hypothetical protein